MISSFSFKRKPLFYVQLFLSSLVILYLSFFTDWVRIRYVLSNISLEYAWQASFLLLISLLIMAIRWSLLLRQVKIGQKILDSWRYYLISMFYGILLPGIIGGDAVRLGLSIQKHDMQKTFLTASVLIERIFGFVIILLIAALTILFAPSILKSEQSLTSVIHALALAAVISLILFFVLLKSCPQKWFSNESRENNIKNKIFLLLLHFRALPMKLLVIILFLSGLAHFFNITGCYLLAKAIHIEKPFSLFLVIIPIVYIVTSLPISFGGLGVREGTLTFFLVKTGVAASDAVLLAFLIYLNRIIVASVGGFIQFAGNKTQSVVAD